MLGLVNRQDYIVYDSYNKFCDIPNHVSDQPPTRASVDKAHNSHGFKLIGMCKSTSLRVVNGRVGQTNFHTLYSHNGCSVIDYLLTHEKNFSCIEEFCIESFNE